MRNITRDAIHCKECGSTLKSEEYDHFCDNCKMKICTDDWPKVSIFWKDCENNNNEDLEFCSYNKKMVDFITLPYIHEIDDLKIFLGDK
jgi:hypothetical protein